ncbi:MAG: hypothetical protein HZA32_03770 [Opitutae bacterium]|nr:hypothetical protein [Opitutae bacterium]
MNPISLLRTFLPVALLAVATALFGVPAAHAARPVIYSFNQSGSTTINLGESVSLNWSVSNGAQVSISPDVGPITGSEATVTPSATTTYTLTATNASGSVSKTKKITVIVPPTVNTLTAKPSPVLPGTAVTLAWTGTGANYYTVTTDSGANLGNVFGTSTKVYPQASTTYTVTAVNTAGTGARSIPVVVVPPGPKPTISSFAAAPATIFAGQSTTLNWSVSGADSVSISPNLGTVTGTTATVTPAATTTYTLTAKNLNGSVTKKTTVTVTVAPPTIDSFTATPPAIVAGQSSTLAWSVSGAASLSISPGVGAVTGSSVPVSPTASTVYTLTATNTGGSVTKTVSLAVSQPVPPPTINSFAAQPATITEGQSTTLVWAVDGAAEISVAANVGASPGVVTGNSVPVTPAQSTTYTLTARNESGVVTRTASVTVNPPAPTIASFAAAPVTIFPGQSSQLSWSVNGSATLTLAPDIGAVSGDTRSVSPQATTTYTLTAANAGGQDSKSVTVNVSAPVVGSFTAEPTVIVTGGSTTLAWAVDGASEVAIAADVGASPGVVTGNSRSVSPTQNTVYTLTATNAAGAVTRTVSVAVKPPAPTISSFAVEPATIDQGGTATLSWVTNGATTVTIATDVGNAPGVVTGNSFDVHPSATTNYLLTATNETSSVTASVKITVRDPAPVIRSFAVAPNSITVGETAHLIWDVSGAATISVVADVGQSPGPLTGNTGSIDVSPAVTTNYTMTATSPGGVVSHSNTQLTVKPATPAPAITSFTADPATIVRGSSTTLTWNVTGADTLSVSPGIGAVTGTSVPASPTATTTYTITATNTGGSVTKDVVVTVTDPVPVTVQINPAAVQLNTSATQAFSASVTGSQNQVVLWSVVETGGGSINSAGLYIAPAIAGTYHVRAVALADSNATAEATVTVKAPVVTPPVNPPGDGSHSVRLMSPNAGQQFLAPGSIRVFVSAEDINNWPDRHRAASVEIMVDDVVQATIPGSQSEFWVYKTNLSGLPAGEHRVWARGHFIDGKVFDSAVVSITVAEPPAYAQVINLTENVVLTGAANYELVGSPSARVRLNGNGFTISSSDSWTGRLTLKNVDVTNLGVLLDPTPGIKVTTTSAIDIENCVFDATNSLDLTANGSATAVLRANDFRSNMYMNVAQFPINLTNGPDATNPVIRLLGSSTAQHFFQGNNVGLSTIEVKNARNWLIGGSTDADTNVLIGPRVGISLEGGSGIQVRRNLSEQLYFGGWSQGNNFEMNSGADLVVEHNLVSGGSWPVRGTGGIFRYNLVLNADEDWLWISQSNAQVHHNVFAEGFNSRAGVFIVYAPQGVQFTNNTLDGFGVSQNQIPLLAEDGATSAIASNVFYRFHGNPIVSIKPTATVNANYNLFYNPGVSSLRNYDDSRHPAQDVGDVNAQVDPLFATPTPPSYSSIDRGLVWNRTLTLQQILATYRNYYTPTAGSPLIDAGDPTSGAGNDIGAVGVGAANAADQFGLPDGGAPTSVTVSVSPTTKSLSTGATATFAATVFGSTNQSVTWSVVENAGGSITSSGVYTAPAVAGTYHVKAVSAADATASAQATITVSAATAPAPTIGSFTATPSTIQPGGTATLAWTVTGADSVTISPDIGAVTGTSRNVSPAATTTYTLTATNTAGSVTRTATVTVSTSTGPSIDTFTASSDSIEAGEAVTLAWTTTKMGSLWMSADAGGDPGSVPANGTLVVRPQTTTRYSVSGWNGETNTTIFKSLTVRVGPPPTPTISSFAASPETIAIGSSTTLNWSVANADKVTIAADVGASPGIVTGNSYTVTPATTTTYTITASLGSSSATATTTVTVTGPTAPVIGSFYAQPAFIQAGANSTLKWSVSGADRISISPDIGEVTGNSYTVSPSATTTYTLSATNEIGTSTRSTVVTIYVPGTGNVSHPRIWVTPASLAALVARAQANDPAWIRLRNACDTYVTWRVAYPDEPNASDTICGGYQYYDYMQPSFELALGYMVAKTVDPVRAARYAAKEREVLLALSDPIHHGRSLIDSGWAIRAYVPALAIGYDWIFETLTDSDRAQIYTEINRWIADYESGGFGRSFPQGNYFAGYYSAKALGALATEGENPQGPAMWNDWLTRVHFNFVQPFHQQWLSGGSAPDGWGYGKGETLAMLRPLAAAFTAKGLDLIHDAEHPHGYPDGNVKWVTQFTWPDMKTVSDRGLIYDGDNFTSTDATWATEYTGLLRLSNGDNTPMAQRYTLDLRSQQGVNSIQPWADFLFFDNTAPTAAYRTALSYATPGAGEVAMRSSWASDAVWASFQAGPYTGYDQSAEEHFDQGGLAIQRGGVQFVVNAWGALLRNTPGTSDGAGSVFTNIYNEVYDRSPVDGVPGARRIFNTYYAARTGGYYGQGASGPGETATTLSRFEEGTDYVLMRGANLEGMYFSDHPIDLWTRTVVYLRPQLFVVHDRTAVNNAATDNWMAWHVAAAPTEQTAAAGTHRFDVLDTRAAFGGNLFRGRVTTVLPAGHVVNTVDLFNYHKVYRLEVRPGTPAATNTWLTVLDASASAAQAGNVTALTAAAGNLSTAAAEGTIIHNAAGNYAVLFSKSAAPIAGSFTLTVPTEDTYVLVADLAPSTGYTVTAAVANGSTVITIAPGGSVMTTGQGTLKVDVTAAGVVTGL